jgi:hypothetical protein
MKTKLWGALCVMVLCAPAAHAGLFGPNDYYSCVLDRMTGVQNDYAANAIVVGCNAEFDWRAPVKRRTGPFARYASGNECFLDKGKALASGLGARVVLFACHTLYDPPPPFDPSTAVPVN